MENIKNRNSFLIACVSCIVLLLVMCYFGINSSSIFKGTSAASTCDGTIIDSYCCPTGYTAGVTSGGLCYNSNWKATASGSYCKTTISTSSLAVTSYENQGYECEQSGSSGDVYVCTKKSYDISGCTKAGTYIDDSDSSSSSSSVANTYACYLNTYTNEYEWRTVSSSEDRTGLTLQSAYSNETSCLANNPKCYECNSNSDLRYWGAYSSDAPYSCPAGWHTLNVSEENCVVYETKTFTATLNGNGGTSSEVSCTATIDGDGNGCYVSLGSASRDNYKFKGWSTSSACSSFVEGSQYLTANKTYYACWEDIYACYLNTYYDEYDWRTMASSEDRTGLTLISVYTDEASCEAANNSSDDNTGGSSSSSNPASSSSTPSSTPSSSSSKPSSSSSAPSSSEPEEPSEDLEPEEPEIPETPDEPEENVDENPKTGEIAMFVVWVIALAAIVYSVWYFKQVKES